MPISPKRSNIQLCYPFEERRLLSPKFGWNFPKQPVIVQPKLDGERCHSIGHILPEIFLISSECNPIISVPHINQALIDQKITKEVDGELYRHGMSFPDIHSIVSRKSEETIHPDAWKMQFHIFDLAEPGSQIERLTNIPKLEPPLILVESHICRSFEDIMYYYDKFNDEGYEGIIVRQLMATYERKRSRFIMKFKPKKTDEYEITDVIEAISKDGEPKGMVGAFECVGGDGTTFQIGAGKLKHSERIDLWILHQKYDDVIGRICRVQYQSLTNKQVPRFGLAIEVI
jgi:ATP-dependent DNA ligase